MKNLLPVFPVLLLLAVSCGPSRHAIHVEMRYPSKTGIDPAGKIVSVVYAENADSAATEFNEYMADGFAYALEQEYMMGDGSVGIYCLPMKEGAVYSSRDSLVSLLMSTGSDVIFLFDVPQLGDMTMGGASSVASVSSPDSSYVSTGVIPFSMKVHCYDAMRQEDNVLSFGGKTNAQPHVYSDGRQTAAEIRRRAYAALPAEAWEVGKTVAKSFESQWKHEQYSIAFYDSQKWYDALDKAEQYDWKGAMNIWFELLDSRDMLKRACAEYNIAVACYMLGDIPLAEQWLDRSDADNKLPTMSDALRKRIDARK